VALADLKKYLFMQHLPQLVYEVGWAVVKVSRPEVKKTNKTHFLNQINFFKKYRRCRPEGPEQS
jgi:hypothetical protein